MNCEKWNAYYALRQVAKKEGISVQQVIQEIDVVIGEAYSAAKKGKDLEVLARWDLIPCKGEIPTALELVAYLGAKCREQ